MKSESSRMMKEVEHFGDLGVETWACIMHGALGEHLERKDAK